MRLKRKIACLMSAVLFMTNLGMCVHAKENESNVVDGVIKEELQSVCNDLIINYQEEIDLNNLYIGGSISAYCCREDGELEKCNFSFYPIFSAENIVLMAMVYEDGTIEWTQGLAEELKSYIGDEIAIIYDRSSCYVYKCGEKSFESVREFSTNVDGRGMLVHEEVCDELQTTILKKETSIQLDDQNDVAICSDAISPTVTLAVPKVLQTPYEWICWAATSASIGNYLRGYSYTAKQIAQSYYGTTNFDQGADLNVVKSVLLNRYSITYSKLNDHTHPTDSMIYNNLSAGYPMYAVLKYSGGYHAAVIRGYDRTAQKIYVMDPEYGYTVARKSNGVYKYTSPATGVTLTVYGYAAYMS